MTETPPRNLTLTIEATNNLLYIGFHAGSGKPPEELAIENAPEGAEQDLVEAVFSDFLRQLTNQGNDT